MTLDTLLSSAVRKPDESIRTAARHRWDRIAKPVDGLGRFEEIVCRIAAMLRDPVPDLSKKALIIMCADNGERGRRADRPERNGKGGCAHGAGAKQRRHHDQRIPR